MRNLLLMFCSIFVFTPAVNADTFDFGVGAKAGINGLGLDVTLGLSENINLRAGVSRIDIEGEDETITVGDSGNEADLDTEVDYEYGANSLFLDWHVFGGGFRLSAGLFKNNGSAEGSSTLLAATVIDGQPLDPSDFSGDIDTEVSLGESYQPYVGLGWGRGAGGDGGFSLSVDVGVALLDPSVDFDATVNAGGANGLSQAELNSALAALEADAEDELDDYELWPVLAIGINYAF